MNDPVVEEVLYQGVSDFVGLTTIYALAGQESESWWPAAGAPDSEAVRQRTLAVCEFLLTRDLMRAGSLSNCAGDPEDFIEWPGTATETLERIASEWDTLVSLEHFEPCWFKSTAEGIRAGELVDR